MFSYTNTRVNIISGTFLYIACEPTSTWQNKLFKPAVVSIGLPIPPSLGMIPCLYNYITEYTFYHTSAVTKNQHDFNIIWTILNVFFVDVEISLFLRCNFDLQ